MLRILHTSDWHLGATLDGHAREAEHALFLDWLVQTLERERIDAVIVAGDVFDHAQPSAEAQRLYYRFLSRVAAGGRTQVVVVGGNHDSAARLDAPRELLSTLRVRVIGGHEADEAGLARALVPVVSHATGEVGAVILAVPFVHEFRLGLRTAGVDPATLATQFAERFRLLYEGLATRAEAAWPGVPRVATGHFACVGALAGDAPAETHQFAQIGGLPPEIFPPSIDYVALGHLHRSFRVGTSRAWYSGTPVARVPGEATTPRVVLIVELERPGGLPRVTPLEVPTFRAFTVLTGDEAAVTQRLRTLTWTSPLPPFVVPIVTVPTPDPELENRLARALEASPPGPRLILCRQVREANDDTAPAPPTRLAELTPEEVFAALCEWRSRPLTPDDRRRGAFAELLAELERGPGEGGA